MKKLKEISKEFCDTVEEFKEDKDIKKAVVELQEIKEQLKKIVKESTR